MFEHPKSGIILIQNSTNIVCVHILRPRLLVDKCGTHIHVCQSLPDTPGDTGKFTQYTGSWSKLNLKLAKHTLDVYGFCTNKEK